MVDYLKKQFEDMKMFLNQTQLSKFDTYCEFMLEYNKYTNLTSIIDKKSVYIKHFLDSLLIAKSVNVKGKLIDIGSGAGFPGVPLKIFDPKIDVTLLDSSRKKTDFLLKLSKILDLELTILNGRAEIFSKNLKFREKFDFCVSRAVASLRVLSELCIPFIKIGGVFVSMKGPSFAHELSEAKPIISTLGGSLMGTENFNLPENLGTRYIISIKKESITSKKFPRNYSKIINI